MTTIIFRTVQILYGVPALVHGMDLTDVMSCQRRRRCCSERDADTQIFRAGEREFCCFDEPFFSRFSVLVSQLRVAECMTAVFAFWLEAGAWCVSCHLSSVLKRACLRIKDIKTVCFVREKTCVCFSRRTKIIKVSVEEQRHRQLNCVTQESIEKQRKSSQPRYRTSLYGNDVLVEMHVKS